MTILRTEPFTYSNTSDLNSVDSKYVNARGTLGIISNALYSSGSGSCGVGYSAGSVDNDQYAKATFSQFTPGSGSYLGVAVRCGSAGSQTFYEWLSSSSDSYIISRTGTGDSVIATSGAFANGDTIELKIVGTTITWRKNGSDVGSATNTDTATGRPGWSGYNNDSSQFIRLDNGELGDFTTASVATWSRRKKSLPPMIRAMDPIRFFSQRRRNTQPVPISKATSAIEYYHSRMRAN